MEYTDCKAVIRGRVIEDVIYSDLREVVESLAILVKNKVYAECDLRITAVANGRRVKELVFSEAKDILAAESDRLTTSRKRHRNPRGPSELAVPCKIIP